MRSITVSLMMVTFAKFQNENLKIKPDQNDWAFYYRLKKLIKYALLSIQISILFTFSRTRKIQKGQSKGHR